MLVVFDILLIVKTVILWRHFFVFKKTDKTWQKAYKNCIYICYFTYKFLKIKSYFPIINKDFNLKILKDNECPELYFICNGMFFL